MTSKKLSYTRKRRKLEKQKEAQRIRIKLIISSLQKFFLAAILKKIYENIVDYFNEK